MFYLLCKCMKRIVIVFLLAFTLNTAAQERVNLGLIPTPQRVKLSESQAPSYPKKIKSQKVDTLPVEANLDQAYQLIISRRQVTIRYVGEEAAKFMTEHGLALEEFVTLYH